MNGEKAKMKPEHNVLATINQNILQVIICHKSYSNEIYYIETPFISYILFLHSLKMFTFVCSKTQCFSLTKIQSCLNVWCYNEESKTALCLILQGYKQKF